MTFDNGTTFDDDRGGQNHTEERSEMHDTARIQRRFMVPEMEGPMARWYARLRGSGSQLEEYRQQAARLTDGLPAGAAVLEVAPGPGYLAIEIARRGHFQVAGLDISRTFVQIASDNARQAGVSVDFRRGDAADLPFAADAFDLIVCQAAFKNFRQPGRALAEMYRVLRPGGIAEILDMCREASDAEIDEEVRRMRLSRLNALLTRWILGTMLRRRAYSRAQFERLAAASPFRCAAIRAVGIGLEVRLTKPATA
jgi:ubiquinone/menaquinone biosynthesis C-methylase UbiE